MVGPEAPLAAPWRSQPGPGARRGSSPSSEPPEPVAGDRSLGAFRLDDEGRVCIEPNRAARGRCALFLQEDGIGYMLGETRGRMPFRVQMTLKP